MTSCQFQRSVCRFERIESSPHFREGALPLPIRPMTAINLPLDNGKHPDTFAAGLIIAGQQRPSDVVDLAKQNGLTSPARRTIKATPWNGKCAPVWKHAGGRVTRPEERLDPALIFTVDDQGELSELINGYLGNGRQQHLPDFCEFRSHGVRQRTLLTWKLQKTGC